MNYTKDFSIFVEIKKSDEVDFQNIQKIVLNKENAFWKDGTKDIISCPSKEIAFYIHQDDEKITVAYRELHQVSDFNGSDILLSIQEFYSFWENPDEFFPPLNEEEKDFFKNLTYGRQLEEEILTLYTLRTGVSLRRAKQARKFDAMTTKKKYDEEAQAKQKKYTQKLRERIAELRAS